jgi:hypothetical protein
MTTRSVAQAVADAPVAEPAQPVAPPAATKTGSFRFTTGSYPDFDFRGTKLVELMQEVKDHHGRTVASLSRAGNALTAAW